MPALIAVMTRDHVPPTRPAGLGVTPVAQGRSTLSWHASEDNVGVSGYEVRHNDRAWVAASGLSHVFTGLTEGIVNKFQVRARDHAGNTSIPASLTVSLEDVTPPGKPGTPVVNNLTGTSVTLSWAAATDNVAVTGYLVSLDQSSPVAVSGTSHAFSNLKEATTYHVEVKARDAAGNLSDGAAVTFSTKD
ncbi:fibronectin type III domain-containing protein, partial [Pseudomonas vancouverensis]